MLIRAFDQKDHRQRDNREIERILRFADIVGRERVIAGTDCGFSTFAGFGAVDENIVYAKLGSMVEGAALASRRLWS